MTSIRVLIPEVPGVAFVKSPTSLVGSAVPFIRARILSLLDNINITFISANKDESSCSSDDGTCSGELADLQHDKGDYLRPPSLIKLKSLGINLTTISPAWEYYCFLAYKKKMKLYVDYSTFFDFVYSFDLSFWIILLTLFGINTVILSYIINQTSITLTDLFWNQYEFIFGQDSLRDFNRKTLLTLFSLSLLLVGILLSCSLQTGLISNLDYLKLDTLRDIVKYKYKPITTFITSCRHEINNDLSPITKQIASKIDIIQFRSPEQFYRVNIQDKHVAIIDQITFDLVKHIGCSTEVESEKQSPYFHSDNFVYNSMTVYLINRHNSPLINSLIIRRAYSAFEFKIMPNENLVKILHKSHSVPDAPQSCLDFNGANKESVAPISLHYLSIPLVILISGYFIGSFLLIISYRWTFKDR